MTFRKSSEHVDDLRAILKDLKGRYPESKIYIASSGSGAFQLCLRPNTSEGNSVVSSWPGRIPASCMPMTIPSKNTGLDDASYLDSCDSSPIIEAKEIADRYSFTLIPFSGGTPDPDTDPCDFRTKHGLLGLDSDAVKMIGDWMEGKPFRHRTPKGKIIPE